MNHRFILVENIFENIDERNRDTSCTNIETKQKNQCDKNEDEFDGIGF